MRSAISITLIVCVVESALPAATGEPFPGPIARAIPREAARLAGRDATVSELGAEQQNNPAYSDWSRVTWLVPGTKIIVTVKGEQPQRRRFGTADVSQMTVRDPTGREEVIARSDVVEIRVVSTRGSVAGAIGGAALGAALGIYFAMNLAYGVRCQPSCGGVEAMIVLSAVGIPVAAGILGYHKFSHSREDVIYRAP